MLYIISFSQSQLYCGRHRVCMIDFASGYFFCGSHKVCKIDLPTARVYLPAESSGLDN